MQERLEASRVGRVAISLFVVVTVLAVLAWNVPSLGGPSWPREYATPYVRPVGLDQSWLLFAPNPRRVAYDLYAEVRFHDGATEIWRPPWPDEPFLSPYRTYRWRKWMGRAGWRGTPRFLWRGAADWLAEQHGHPQRPVAEVRLVLRSHAVDRPGQPVTDPDWEEQTVHTVRFAPGTGG